MKKNRKILGGFVACLHCCLMALPLFTLLFNAGRNCLQANLSYESTYTYDNDGNFQTSSKEFDLAKSFTYAMEETLLEFNYIDESFTYDDTWSVNIANSNDFPFLMNNDFFGLFVEDSTQKLNDSSYTYLFINFYLNWIINMSVIVFVPELIVVFLDMCRKLVYSFSHKINGGF